MYFDKDINIDKLISLLELFGIQRIIYRERESHYFMPLRVNRLELLDLAEKLSVIPLDWLEKGVEYIDEQLLYHEIESLLSIPGVSGKEHTIREDVKEKLTPLVDYITVDEYGNLLAEKTYRNGHGPTILLNAHLDTVDDISEKRTIVKDGSIWTSSEGILGAELLPC